MCVWHLTQDLGAQLGLGQSGGAGSGRASAGLGSIGLGVHHEAQNTTGRPPRAPGAAGFGALNRGSSAQLPQQPGMNQVQALQVSQQQQQPHGPLDLGSGGGSIGSSPPQHARPATPGAAIAPPSQVACRCPRTACVWHPLQSHLCS